MKSTDYSRYLLSLLPAKSKKDESPDGNKFDEAVDSRDVYIGHGGIAVKVVSKV